MRTRQSAWRTPAVQALIIQCASFLLTILVMRGIWVLAGMQVTIVVAALLQGTIAAAVSFWRRLAPWWLPMQFLFPGALIAMHSLSLPPGIFLALFVFLLGWYWTTFRTQVPFYPSGLAVWEAVAGLLPVDRPVRFIDIGSGLGGLVLNLAARRPESTISGIELAPLPWLASWLRAWMVRSRGRFIRGDYTHLDFAQYDVVFAYLSPAAMPALGEKSRTEMRPGTLLLSYEFSIPGVVADVIVTPQTHGPILYAWRF
ncbi:SAM-dependent methyltransferase [Sulfuriferula plumbiphila]|uniref:SAM-dependent methyltransferase n=1 Tax=Sulfuriferula plumbiphila TaxID=171865 RepID=UPI001CB98A97|nr:class I SAM-dependent methyltransferase [Sulfuriferula plumbiphila]